MSVGLLDTNVLIALAWPTHVHHDAAHKWFKTNHAAGWATCPMTQCGFVRVSSCAQLLPDAVTPSAALAVLQRMADRKDHSFWPDDISVHEAASLMGIIAGHRQIMDAYLLALAIRHNGKLITIDKGVVFLLPANSQYQKALEVIPV